MFIFTATAKFIDTNDVDKNGNPPMVLRALSGHSPRNLNIISGSLSKLKGFENNKHYAILAFDKHLENSRQFTYVNIGELSTIEVIREMESSPLKIAIKNNDTDISN